MYKDIIFNLSLNLARQLAHKLLEQFITMFHQLVVNFVNGHLHLRQNIVLLGSMTYACIFLNA